MPQSSDRYILSLRCPDVKGVVAAVSSFLFERDASILESNQFNDPVTDVFYMRVHFRPDGPRFPSLDVMRDRFAGVAAPFHMDWEIHDLKIKPRLLIAVSKFGHCLFDLLHRWRSGLLGAEIVGVVSNHEDMRSFCDWSSVPYFYLPVSAESRPQQEADFLELIEANAVDLVVLARYMQVLSPQMCAAISGRCINIHHSFLPGFKGASPYRQAHERGVKIIGATAHYVTQDLDEGPIIEQDVVRVTHAHSPADLVQIGRDIECQVLARAVTWHCQRRVILNGAKTVVFA